jgi:hypothetical protein
MTFFEKLTNRQPRVFYVLFCETNQKNKFVNEENNLYQDLVGSHKATMLQFLHLSQVKNFQPLRFLCFLCPCHKVATRFFSKWLQILSWLLACDCILMSKNQWRGPKQKSMEGTETKINGGYVSVPSIDFWQNYVNSKKRPFRIFSKWLRVFSLFFVHKCECFMMF